jgi:SAM-dependent methyltransferase
MDAASLRKLSQSYNQKRSLSEEFWIAFFNNVEGSLGAGNRCLDLGCGSGRILLPLAERFPDVRFLGIDVSVDMLLQMRAAIASVTGPGNIDLAQVDANVSLPIAGIRFDCVCLFQTIHYLNMAVVYDQLKRLVSDGALLIIASTTHDQLRELPYCAYRPVLDFELARTPDAIEIERMAQANGYTVISQQDFEIHRGPMNRFEIAGFLQTLPYSALCVLDADSLTTAIAQTVAFVESNDGLTDFKADAFRLTVYRYGG